jgi:hypothetical protein
MHRRAFLASLGLAPLVARSYFDMGPSWQRHDSGLLVPGWIDLQMANGERRFYVAGHPVKSIDSVYFGEPLDCQFHITLGGV